VLDYADCWPHHQLNFSTLNSYNEPVRSGLFVSSTAHPFVNCCHPEHTRSDDWCTYLHVEDSGQDDSHDLKDEQRPQQHSTLQTYTQTLIYIYIIIQIIKTAGEKACEKLTFVDVCYRRIPILECVASTSRRALDLSQTYSVDSISGGVIVSTSSRWILYLSSLWNLDWSNKLYPHPTILSAFIETFSTILQSMLV